MSIKSSIYPLGYKCTVIDTKKYIYILQTTKYVHVRQYKLFYPPPHCGHASLTHKCVYILVFLYVCVCVCEYVCVESVCVYELECVCKLEFVSVYVSVCV